MFTYNNDGPIIKEYSPISSKGGKKTKIVRRKIKTRNNKSKKSRTKRRYN